LVDLLPTVKSLVCDGEVADAHLRLKTVRKLINAEAEMIMGGEWTNSRRIFGALKVR
jgi:hypothetical protein